MHSHRCSAVGSQVVGLQLDAVEAAAASRCLDPEPIERTVMERILAARQR